MKYRDEEDKCYGVTGMAVGLTLFNAEELFSSITIESDGLDCIAFTPQYYFSGNPAMSAKDSWEHILSHYQVTSGVVIADALCRKIFHDKKSVDKSMRKKLFDVICEEGKVSCQLEADEVERMFDKSFSYLMNIFANRQVQGLVREFAGELKRRRTMTQHEVWEALGALR